MCQFRPWGVDPAWRTVSGWFHNDRVAGPPVTAGGATMCGSTAGIYNSEYIQGFVNLVKTSEGTGGNVVVAGSHKHYVELALEYYGEGAGGVAKAIEEVRSLTLLLACAKACALSPCGCSVRRSLRTAQSPRWRRGMSSSGT